MKMVLFELEWLWLSNSYIGHVPLRLVNIIGQVQKLSKPILLSQLLDNMVGIEY